MSLVGKYVCPILNATLQVTEINDLDGQGKGVFTIEGVGIPVEIQNQLKDNVDPKTTIRFWGGTNIRNHYVGVAGYSVAQTYANISFSGGYTIEIEVQSFSGNFIKK